MLHINIIKGKMINIISVYLTMVSEKKQSCKMDVYNARYNFHGKTKHINLITRVKNAYIFLYMAN